MSPTLLVTAVDKDVDISMVFNLVEEETKETKEKSIGINDDFFKKSCFSMISFDLVELKRGQNFFTKILAHLHCPGEVAPPPEFS